MYNFEQDGCKKVHFVGHNVAWVGGSRDELKAYQKIVMSSSVPCKNYCEGVLNYPTFFNLHFSNLKVFQKLYSGLS